MAYWQSTGAGDRAQRAFWVTEILKDATQPLPNLLFRLADVPSGTDGDYVVLKQLCEEVLQLVQEYSVHERKLREAGSAVLKKSSGGNSANSAGSWIHIIHAVAKNLTFSDTQHFYNLGNQEEHSLLLLF